MIKLNKVLSRYGQLKSFHLEKEKDEIISKGYAFCEYIDEESTEAALKFLNGFNLDGKIINVKKANNLDSLPPLTSHDDANLSDYDRVRQQIQNKEKNELEERFKKQQELERKRAFDLLSNNYKSQTTTKPPEPSPTPTQHFPEPPQPQYYPPPQAPHPYPPAPYYYPPTAYPPHYPQYPPHPYYPPKYPMPAYPNPPGYPDPKLGGYPRPPLGPYGYPMAPEIPQIPNPYYPYPTGPESVPSSVPPVRQDEPKSPAGLMQLRPAEKAKEIQKIVDETSTAICLDNFLKTEDLEEDEEYLYTYDDIKNELSNYGTVEQLIIPRPKDVAQSGDAKAKYSKSSLLKVYCKYSSVESAKAAIDAMSRKAFDNNLVKATFYSLQKFDKAILE